MKLESMVGWLRFQSRLCLALSILSIPILGRAQDGYPRDRKFDVIHYQFKMDFYENSKGIDGETRIVFVPEKDCKNLFFDLVTLSDKGSGMEVFSISNRQGKMAFEHKEDRLTIPYQYQGKEQDTLIIRYSGIPADGLIISRNKHGHKTVFGDNWPNRAHHWLPVVDHPTEKALMEFWVKHPSSYQVVSNGELWQIIDVNDGMKITKWISSRELPTKVAVIGMAQFAVENVRAVNGAMVSTWVYPEEMDSGFYDYAMCADILQYFIQKIAPFPFEKLANVQSKTRYGGMENAGCIFYHENSIDGKRGSEELFAHEIAHQWFGNSASEADWHHVWLSEGFATYLTEVYKEDVKGRELFKEGMEGARKRVVKYQSKYPQARIVDTSITNLNALLSPMTYQKAAWFLHMLRIRIGEDAFWTGVKNYYRKYQFSNAYSNDLRRELEVSSGINLESYFDKWLYQPGMVKPDLEWSYDEKSNEVLVSLNQPMNKWFPWSANFTLTSVDNKVYISQPFHSNDAMFQTRIKVSEKPIKVEFDAENNVLKW